MKTVEIQSGLPDRLMSQISQFKTEKQVSIEQELLDNDVMKLLHAIIFRTLRKPSYSERTKSGLVQILISQLVSGMWIQMLSEIRMLKLLSH